MAEGRYHEVQQGESAMMLAAANGLLMSTLWDHPNNAELKKLRKDPHILKPGDRIFIPALAVNEEDGATEQTHRFEIRSQKTKLKLVLKENDKALAHLKYKLKIGTKVIDGRTKGDGSIEEDVPITATQAELRVSPGEEGERFYIIQLASLDPITEISGVQARLKNMGFPITSLSDQLDDETREALRQFQEKYSLNVTGEPDASTQNKIKEVYGC